MPGSAGFQGTAPDGLPCVMRPMFYMPLIRRTPCDDRSTSRERSSGQRDANFWITHGNNFDS
ncbi:hypothetical protein HMPREF9582_01739 [Cutibacterium acnes HL060PA1]|nr:hypothetical protein HMPREF9580_00111 [Cutibacterium acnes HL087PA2]EFT09077.1 hypothetical protein HMPREF9619_02558 [Cutibacterium acnes HL082PA2]EFT65697.1 hypothetical protein HMPREF9582_01739 [Cutibacterium acnes HL060PA1]EGE67340.1 hypothetical protein HMPREF9341_02354 [Cutibacterium acnes HL103PA1]